jgi:hypothetical protein
MKFARLTWEGLCDGVPNLSRTLPRRYTGSDGWCARAGSLRYVRHRTDANNFSSYAGTRFIAACFRRLARSKASQLFTQ